jgi:RHS repeat-associated protein
MGCLKLHIIEEEFLQEGSSSTPLKHNIAFDKNDSKHCISYDIGCGECYRYSFNGMENDAEIKGTGNSLDFGARIYDSRLAKFFSIDPLYREIPYQSPFAFANNNPIRLIDKNGESGDDPQKWVNEVTRRYIKATRNIGKVDGEIDFLYQIIKDNNPRPYYTNNHSGWVGALMATKTETNDLPANEFNKIKGDVLITFNEKKIAAGVHFLKVPKEKSQITALSWTGKLSFSGYFEKEVGYYLEFKNADKFTIGYLRFDTQEDLYFYIKNTYDKSRIKYYTDMYDEFNPKPSPEDEQKLKTYKNEILTESNEDY